MFAPPDPVHSSLNGAPRVPRAVLRPPGYDRGATSKKLQSSVSRKDACNQVFNASMALPRGAILTLAFLLAAALAACSGGGGGETDGGGGGATVAVVDGAVEINADDLEFDASTIEAPAGEEFTVTLNNLESQPHNFAVYVSDGGEEIVKGEIITGPDATVDTVVPALEPGTYFFKCDVHPDMNGTIVVAEASASGG
jgi:plastocyanin